MIIEAGVSPKVRVYLRYDDYSAVSDRRVDEGLVAILRRAGVSCTFGIIPSVTSGESHVPGDREETLLSGEKLAFIRECIAEGVVDPAVHGWNHRTHAGALPPRPSEFAGLSLDRQQDRIDRACEFFDSSFGARPTAFIPPWNSYDSNTLAALERAGITRISGNREGPVVQSTVMRYAPITIEMASLRSAVEAARRSSDMGVAIGVMLHPYDFRESADPRSSYSLAEFEREIQWLRSMDDVDVGSIAHIESGAADITAARFVPNRETALERIFPSFIPRTQHSPLYRSRQRAESDRIRRTAGALAFHIAVFIAAMLVTAALYRAVPVIPVVVRVAGAALSAAAFALIAARAARSREIYFKAVVVLSALAGVCAGSLL